MRLLITVLAVLALAACAKKAEEPSRAELVAKRFVAQSIKDDPQAQKLISLAKQSFGRDLVPPMEGCMAQAFVDARVNDQELDMLESVFDGKTEFQKTKVPASIQVAMIQFRECLQSTAAMMNGGMAMPPPASNPGG